MRVAALVYGAFAYLVFFGVFVYQIGFVGNLGTPTALDGEPHSSLGFALAVDLLLILAFGLQHSVMARPGFKRAWTRLVPEPVERSTYVLVSALVLAAVLAFWQPIAGTVWELQASWARALAWTLFASGWVLVFVSTHLIDHWDLFGLRQVWLYFRGRDYTPPRFASPWLYRQIRHPLYAGFLMAFWATPHMTAGHLLFALGMTAYVLVAIQLEERDLLAEHGESYARFRAQVPMLIPGLRVGTRAGSETQAESMRR